MAIHTRPISTYLLSRIFRSKLKAVLAGQVTFHLNTDGADSTELEELVARFNPRDEESWRIFENASALTFRRFTETAMSLIEIETGDTKVIEHHEPSTGRVAAFMAGRITRHELYFVGSTWRLRKLAESANAHNDLNHTRANNTPVGTRAQQSASA